MKQNILKLVLILYLSSLSLLNLFAEDQQGKLKPLLEKLKIKKLEPINSVKLKILPINLKTIKLGSILKSEVKKTKKKELKVIREGSLIGRFLRIEWGDYQHLYLRVNGEEVSFWCYKGCMKLEKIKDKKNLDLLVLWREVERFIPEANETMNFKETKEIIINTKKEKQFYPCKLYSALPHIEKGCEGEACGILKYDKAIKKVPVYKEPSLSSVLIGSLNRCDKIEGFEPFSILKEWGWVRILKANKQLEKLNIPTGAVIPLIKSLGEGYLTACALDQEIDSMVDGTDGYSASVKILLHNKSEGWVKVTSSSGKKGFISEDENFYMDYYSYEPSQFCPEDNPCGPNFLHALKSQGPSLTRLFSQHCRVEKDCNRSDPSKDCGVAKKVWADFKSLIPGGVQCAGFNASSDVCGNEWGGSLSCSCQKDKVDYNLYYSYTCQNNNRPDCKFNIKL